MHGLDARFAARAPLRHALRRLDPVDVVRVNPSIADANTFAERCVQRHIDRGNAPRDRQRSTGEEWKPEALRGLHHRNALIPVGGKMLVVEDRHRAAAAFKNFHGALKEVMTRVECLALFRAWIKTMFGDDDHAIDRKLGAAERECFFDRGINFDSMPTGAIAAEIAVWKLIDVERGKFHGWTMMPALPAVAFEETVDEMLRVRIFPNFRGEQGNSHAPPLGRIRRYA